MSKNRKTSDYKGSQSYAKKGRQSHSCKTIRKNNLVKAVSLHPNNPHQGRYDFECLEKANSSLSEFVVFNPRGEKTIDFSNPKAVLCLNESLLKAYYGLSFWQIPKDYLCPPIPGRADYIHNLADVIESACDQKTKNTLVERPFMIKVLDIGCGANCIYPIIGSHSYGWDFVGVDTNPVALDAAELIVKNNKNLKNKIKLRQQSDASKIFDSIIKRGEQFVLTLCNPPFHKSMQDASKSTNRKLVNLSLNKNTARKKTNRPILNFSGVQQELCYEGGEIAFLTQMATESVAYANQVCWFSSLISKQENVLPMKSQLNQLGACSIQEIPMAQGQKNSRCIVWSFFTPEEQTLFLARLVADYNS